MVLSSMLSSLLFVLLLVGAALPLDRDFWWPRRPEIVDALFRQILVVAALASMVATEAKVVEVVMGTTVAAVQAISIHY